MLVSCKLSHSILKFLEKKNFDASFIYENFEVADELLTDPNYWLPIEQLESFLFIAKHHYENDFPDVHFIEAAAHSSHILNAWGVLDSVLRMMGQPSEIFTQPSRILSYFISGDLQISDVKISGNSVSFHSRLNADEYPLVSQYLCAALEGLPLYMAKEKAKCEWNGGSCQIEWADSQEELFSDSGKTLSPDLIQSIVSSLQESQSALESRTKELAEKAQKPMPSGVDKKWVQPLNGNLQKMKDYFTRANQLITILVGQNRMDRQVKEAMRRMDWEYTQAEFPKVMEESLKIVREIPQKTDG